MSKRDDVDGDPPIEPSNIVSSLSSLASPANGSQIGLQKENTCKKS
jgi:hypothetical protein